MPILELKQSLQKAVSATGNGLNFMCEGLAFVTMQVTGTFVATITFEATVNGTDWVAVQAKNENDGSVATTATAVGLYSFSVAGYLIVRARVTWASGTSVTVVAKGTKLAPGIAPNDVDIAFIATGDNVIGQVKITDGTDVVDVVSHEGQVSLRVVPGHKPVFSAHLDADAIVTATGFMLIDLSDNSNWPHTNTHHIIIESYRININPSNSYAGDIEIGFLTSVDDSNGDFNIIETYHIDQTGSEINQVVDLSSFGMDLELSEWFGPTTADDTTFQTDVSILGPDGNSYPSGNGDLVMKINRTAGTVDVGITVHYTTVSS